MSRVKKFWVVVLGIIVVISIFITPARRKSINFDPLGDATTKKPQLTEAEKARAEQIALDDQRVIEKIAGRDFKTVVGRWTAYKPGADGQQELVAEGAEVSFYLKLFEDDPYYYNTFVVAIDLDKGQVFQILDTPVTEKYRLK